MFFVFVLWIHFLISLPSGQNCGDITIFSIETGIVTVNDTNVTILTDVPDRNCTRKHEPCSLCWRWTLRSYSVVDGWHLLTYKFTNSSATRKRTGCCCCCRTCSCGYSCGCFCCSGALWFYPSYTSVWVCCWYDDAEVFEVFGVKFVQFVFVFVTTLSNRMIYLACSHFKMLKIWLCCDFNFIFVDAWHDGWQRSSTDVITYYFPCRRWLWSGTCRLIWVINWQINNIRWLSQI